MADRDDTRKALTRREVAAQIGVAVDTLSRWYYQGRGPRCVKDGKVCRYPIEEVDRWLRGEFSNDGGSNR